MGRAAVLFSVGSVGIAALHVFSATHGAATSPGPRVTLALLASSPDRVVNMGSTDRGDDLSRLRSFTEDGRGTGVDRSGMVCWVNDRRQHQHPRSRVQEPDVAYELDPITVWQLQIDQCHIDPSGDLWQY